MAELIHVVTVDPSGAIARMVRAALELTGQVIIQIDVRTPEDALDEMRRTGCHLLVTALDLGELHGVDLAAAVQQAYPDAAVIILGADDDPPELDADAYAAASFAYLRRPVDAAQFVRALVVGLGGQFPGESYAASSAAPRRAAPDADLGPIPPLDMKAAERIIDALLIDVGAMAIIVANRFGDVLLERGAVGYLDREQLASALLPTVRSTIDMGQLVGGSQPAALQFYDGDRYDVFVLSIGFHHFMCLVFDGQAGSRQFGAVNRFARRAAEDLVTLLGIFAFTITPAAPPAPQNDPLAEAPAAAPTEPLIERAQEWAQPEPEPDALPEPEALRLEPLENLDPSLFDVALLEELDAAAADDLFNPERLAEIANETRRERGPLSYDEARELGIIP